MKMHYTIPDFRIQDSGEISRAFLDRGILSFKDAMSFVKQLPYHRNGRKDHVTVVLQEMCGTCSTKHALIKRLADEQGLTDTNLVLGVFMMNGRISPEVNRILDSYNLHEIPEAHNYLKYKGAIIDLSFDNQDSSSLPGQPVEELIISAQQIADFKVKYHQMYMKSWLELNNHIPYQFEELWAIREECIQALAS